MDDGHSGVNEQPIDSTAESIYQTFSEYLEVSLEDVEKRLTRLVSEYNIPIPEARRSIESHYIDEAELDPANIDCHYEHHTEAVTPEVLEIQDNLGVSRRTAFKWNEYIGDVDTVNQELGKNAPDGYVDLVIQREIARGKINRRKKDIPGDEYIEPLRDWRRNRRLAILKQEGNPEALQEIQQEFRRRRRVIRDHLIRTDDKIQEAKHQIADVDRELLELYSAYLDNTVTSEFTSKKARIIGLKRAFPYLRGVDSLVAQVVDTTPGYCAQIKYIPEEGIRDRQVPTQLRNQVLDRDGNTCVRCGSGENLEAHHIVPRSDGGDDELDNMATLCSDCHNSVHNSRCLPYEDVPSFWNWANEEA